MGLLKIQKEDPQKSLVKEADKRHNKLVDSWINLGLWSVAMALLAFTIKLPVTAAASFIGIWAIYNIGRTLRFHQWKKLNAPALNEARKALEKKAKQANQLAAIQRKLDIMDKELSPDEWRQTIDEQAEDVLDALAEVGITDDRLPDIIRKKVDATENLINNLEQLENCLEEQDPDFLAKEKELYIAKATSTDNEALQQQLYETIALLDQRIAQIKKLKEDRKVLLAKLTSFHQALENLQLQAANYLTKDLNNNQTAFDGSGELSKEMAILDKVQSELDAITYRDEDLQKDLEEMRRQRAQQDNNEKIDNRKRENKKIIGNKQ